MDRRARTDVFLGLNRTPYIKEGEFRRMKNLSSDCFPYASARTPYEEYKFDISVPGVAGDGYDSDVTNLPNIEKEDDKEKWYGKIVYLISTQSPKPGTFYYKKGAEWVKGISSPLFKGVLNEAPEGATIILDGTAFHTYLYETNRRGDLNPYGEYNYAANTQGRIFKYLGENTENFEYGKAYEYKFEQWHEWQEPKSVGWDKKVFYSGEMEAYLTDIDSGKVIWYQGPTTTEFVKNTFYQNIYCAQGNWVENADKPYTAVTKLPDLSEAEEGMQYRYIGTEQPRKGFYYKVQRDTAANGNTVYFFENITAAESYEAVTQLPEADAESFGKVYLYSGEDAGKYYQCVYVDGTIKWQETERPYVIKNVTIPEYAEKYSAGLKIKEVLTVHGHTGGLSALVRAENGVLFLYYNKEFYHVPNIAAEKDTKLISCGNKLLIGANGTWIDTKKKTFNEGTTEFNFSIVVDDFTDHRGNTISTFAGTDVIKICSQDKVLLDSMASALKETGIEFEMHSARQKIKYPYRTKSFSADSPCAEVYKKGWGYKIGDAWVNVTFYVLNIYIEPVDASWYRIFDNDEIFLRSSRSFYDVEVWKKRLWSYYDNVIKGSAADIFSYDENNEPDKINWNKFDNDYLDSIDQPLWQGGDITGLAALTDAMIFFKDSYLSVMTGNYPAIMSASSISCPGVSAGNKHSIAVANDSVFYLSDDGVYKFSGGFPVLISENLKLEGNNAVSGTDGRKYYISLKEKTGKENFYVYDIRRGLWHSEEFKNVTSFALINGKVHFVSEGKIFTAGGDEDVSYEAEMEFDEETCRKKKYKELLFRGTLENCTVSLRGDDGEWLDIAQFSGNEHKIKLNPIRCEKLSVRLSGKGTFLLKSLERVFEVEN